ncbi:MATE family efflux transporter [Flammeovirga agarivorans]|uniref:Multidrug-efflux transporter n=1 Tax=Flammeovirga agarivorans TaxID=2726742 RepID=A0A7X8SJS8_9BACT|nr:MATE family efflux transporter [Flammeovirga agarivorans]NLR91521.1 MATE family efflux transporter [Flammeovirga agarivorans]
MKSKTNSKDLTDGPVLKRILALSVPIIGAMFMQTATNVVDIVWIGKLGSDAVAGVGTSTIFLQLVWAFASIFLVSSGVLVSQAIGENKNKKAKEYSRDSVKALMLIIILMGIILQVYFDEIIGFFNFKKQVVIDSAYVYLSWMSIFLIFSLGTLLLTQISNSRGDAKKPFLYFSIGVVINLVLDPIFIFTFGWGVAGAAWATGIAQFIAFALFLRKSFRTFFGGLTQWGFRFIRINELIKVGLPTSLERIIFTVVGIAITKIISDWGSDAIAAQKIGNQLEAITFMCISGLSSAMLSFTGQNYGAKKFDRIKKGYFYAMIISLLLGVVTGLLFYHFDEELMGVFVSERNTILIGADYLEVLGVAQVSMCVEMVTTGIINGLGRTKYPAVINTSMTVIRVPLAFFLANNMGMGVDGVWYAIGISVFLRALFLTVAYFYLTNKLLKSEVTVS